LKGVIKIAASVAMAVKLTDNATFPLPRADIKLEMLPPGQAATKIIPNATAGEGFKINTKRNVTKGKRKNCDAKPIITDFGFFITFLKFSRLISNATPNIINASVIFINSSPP